MNITELPDKEEQAFYTEAMELLNQNGIPFLIGGAFAIFHYTGIYRNTKDLDIFIKSSDYPKALEVFSAKYKIELHDVRWLAKVFKGSSFIDLIFNSVNNICFVDDTWLELAPESTLFGVPVKIQPAEELIWCKSYVWNRERFDGADVNHVILKYGKQLDWKRILRRLDHHWHLLLAEIIMFQFVYPSDYQDIIPKWLFDELMARANHQYTLPPTALKICRGPIIDNTQYKTDIVDAHYKASTITTL